MLKLLGSILIITASTGMAAALYGEIADHVKRLYELRKLFVDISYAAYESMQPVEILLGCFVRTRDEKINDVCKEIADQLIEKKLGQGDVVWRNVFAAHRKELGLSAEEAEVIEGAGSAFFGKSVDENKKHLAVTLERLDFLIGAKQSGQKEKQRVCGAVSILGGLMIIILLI